MYKFFLNIIFFILFSIIIVKLVKKFFEVLFPKKHNIKCIESKALSFFNLTLFIFITIFFSYYIYYILMIFIILFLILIIINNNNYFKIRDSLRNVFNDFFLKIAKYFQEMENHSYKNENFILYKYNIGNSFYLTTLEKKIHIYAIFNVISCFFKEEVNVYGKANIASSIFEKIVKLNVINVDIEKTVFKDDLIIIIENKNLFKNNFLEIENSVFEKNIIIKGLDVFELNSNNIIHGKIIYKN